MPGYLIFAACLFCFCWFFFLCRLSSRLPLQERQAGQPAHLLPAGTARPGVYVPSTYLEIKSCTQSRPVLATIYSRIYLSL